VIRRMPPSIQATASHPSRSNLPLMVRAVAFLALLMVACTASAADVLPPNGEPGATDKDGNDASARFFWPTGLALTPDQSLLFVANANSDLRYNSGAIDVVDLDVIDAALAGWLKPAAERTLATDCSQDTDFTETMVCKFEAAFMRREASVRIGSFATSIAVQDLGTGGPPGDLRLIVPVRGDPSITWMEWSAAQHRLVCDGGDGAGFPQCDDDHRLTRIRNDSTLPGLSEEPWDVYVDSTNQYAMVTHLTTGTVTLVDSPRSGTPVIADVQYNLFGSTNGLVLGATSVVGRNPGSTDDIVYVASRSEDRVQTFSVVRPPKGGLPYLGLGNYFFLDAVGNQVGSSIDARGMVFGAGGDRMYTLNRDPPSLQFYDTSMSPSGVPYNVGIGSVDVCRDGSRVAIANSGDGDRLYVSCFSTSELYVIDPRGGGQVEDVITVGHGPYDVVASPTRKRLYVTNYLEHSLAVVDIAPGSPTRNRVVLRLGKPNQP